MLGARLVSVQKLLGHSDRKITERRYGHLLPDFMKSEVDRLRFGLDKLAPQAASEGGPHSRAADIDGRVSQDFAAVSAKFGIPLVSAAAIPRGEAGTTPGSGAIPASLLAGCTGLEPVASGVTGRRYNRLS